MKDREITRKVTGRRFDEKWGFPDKKTMVLPLISNLLSRLRVARSACRGGEDLSRESLF